MGHAAEREKKIINLERLIAREKEREEEKRTSDCRQKGERERERGRERDGRFAQNGSLCNPEIQKGEEINTAAAQKTRLAKRRRSH